MSTTNMPSILDNEGYFSDINRNDELCKRLMQIPHYAKMGIHGVISIISKSKSIGMDPIEALNGGLYYLQGRVGMPAETMAALIRMSGHSIMRDAKSNDSVCILHGRRVDNGDTWTSSFGLDDAKRAGLLKNMYEKYPSAMLYNRALSFLARQLFPDIIKGAAYTMGELEEIDACNSNTDIKNLVEDPAIGLNSVTPTIKNCENRTPKIAIIPPPAGSSGLLELNQMSDDTVISPEQYQELKTLFDSCDTEYIEKIKISFLELKIPCLQQLPLKLYERVKSAFTKKVIENQRARTNHSMIDEDMINAIA